MTQRYADLMVLFAGIGLTVGCPTDDAEDGAAGTTTAATGADVTGSTRGADTTADDDGRLPDDGTTNNASATAADGTTGLSDSTDAAGQSGTGEDTAGSKVPPVCVAFGQTRAMCEAGVDAAEAAEVCASYLEMYASAYGPECLEAAEAGYACLAALDCRSLEDVDACPKTADVVLDVCFGVGTTAG